MVNTNLNSGYFEVSGSGSNLYYKIQIEDAAALNGGTNPNGKWNYVTTPDSENRQNDFQGSGYYVYGSDTSTGLNEVNQNEILEFEIEVPTALIGKSMNFRVRASRDGMAASDQQNDLWLNVVHKDGSGSIEEFLTQTVNEAEPTSKEFIKVFGGPNNGNWGYASLVDGAPDNFSAEIAFPEEGRYILQIAGRSQGFHLDFIELATGSLGSNTADSTFVPTDPQSVQLVNEIPDQTFTDGTIDIFDLPTSTFFDRNGDEIAYQIEATAANGSDVSGVTINETTGQISGLSTLAIDTYQLTITANDPHGAATDTFEIDIVDELALETLVIPIDTASDDYEQFGEGGSADLELGLNGSQQEVGIRFTGIDIPAGAEISYAFIRFTAFDSNAASASFTIGIEDSENAATFTSANDLLGRTTAAELDWSNGAAWTAGETYNTPDLTALIQQAIGSDGVDNGALAFLINGTTPTSSRVAQTFSNGNAAELVIEFDSSTPTNPPISPIPPIPPIPPTPKDPEVPVDDDGAQLPENSSVSVSLASDDYEQFGEGGSADLELGLNGSQQEVGIRFTEIDIPAGAEITNAFIRFTAFDSNAASASFTIGIEDSENAATFTSAN
ncbi:MAG: putative Ig domain-containing protein, partial [Pleurocapsa sp.]